MLEEIAHVSETIVRGWHENGDVLMFGVALLWIVHGINYLLGYRLCMLGLYPRSIAGLIGIFFAPLLHGSFNHIFMNTITGVALAALVVLNGRETLIGVTLAIMLIAGMLLWVFGRKAVHIGASGLVMGYWGYILVAAYQQPTLISIFTGGICFYFFSEMASNVVPTGDIQTTSWEGHLLGVIAGVITALILPSESLFLR